MNQDGISELDAVIVTCQKQIELGKAVERLYRNPDFKKVVGEGYFEKEPIRLVHAMSSPVFNNPEKREALLREMEGVSRFSAYLSDIVNAGERAVNQLHDTEELRQNLIEEESNDE